MSSRGWLVTSPGRASKLLAESKRFIPLTWLSLLSTDDLDRAENIGAFDLDRKRAVERATSSIPFLAGLFPEVGDFASVAGAFLGMIGAKGAKVLGLTVVELLEEAQEWDGSEGMPTLRTAIEAIEIRNPDFALVVPPRTVLNPFTRDGLHIAERRFGSTREMLLWVCSIQPEDLTSRKRGDVWGTLLGYVHDWNGSLPPRTGSTA